MTKTSTYYRVRYTEYNGKPYHGFADEKFKTYDESVVRATERKEHAPEIYRVTEKAVKVKF